MKRKYILPLFLLFQILFLKVIAYFPNVVERFYSNRLYVYNSKFFRTLLGKIPFSVGDVFYTILILWILKCIWNSRKSWKTEWKNNILSVLGFVSIVYFAFHFLWALNYYRVPLFEKMNIKREYSEEDLYAFTDKLIAKTNEIQFEITKNKNLKVIITYSQDSIFKLSQNGYDNLKKEYSFFRYENPSRKKSLFSLPLTYMGFGGYLNPFTGEAQVNDKIPMVGFPMTINHEMAHQIGYASESECNFIGFLACVKNKDLYFQYSAYSNALRYCMSNIGMKNESKFIYFKSKINTGILENYKENELFWEEYDTIIDKGFHVFYDQFLKVNQQKDGIESYSKFVDLLVNYYGGEL
ncbi:DUF3810 domain-containing protein [Flavobacterium sp.]|uniref:DUF3810 domain-containing protein n=1 Tax=Flavobacterium sp. TaxID=239 RepID=UPI00375257CA